MSNCTRFPTRLTNASASADGVVLDGEEVKHQPSDEGVDSGYSLHMGTGDIHMETLHLAGTELTASVAELNALDKVSAAAAESNKVARYDGSSKLVVGTPTGTTHATTKAYVDGKFGSITMVSNGIYGSGTPATVLMGSDLLVPTSIRIRFQRDAASTVSSWSNSVTINKSAGQVEFADIASIASAGGGEITVNCNVCNSDSLVFVTTYGIAAHLLHCGVTDVQSGAFTVRIYNMHSGTVNLVDESFGFMVTSAATNP